MQSLSDEAHASSLGDSFPLHRTPQHVWAGHSPLTWPWWCCSAWPGPPATRRCPALGPAGKQTWTGGVGGAATGHRQRLPPMPPTPPQIPACWTSCQALRDKGWKACLEPSPAPPLVERRFGVNHPTSCHGAHLGSREAPLRGTGSSLRFFFPYTRYILGARARVAWRGHQGADLPQYPPPILPS